MKKYAPWLCAVLSGILLALSFPPADFDGLAWVALAPVLWAIWFSEPWTKREPLRIFLLGYIAGLGYFVGSLQWLTTVTVAGWLALAAYLAVYPALWALFVGLMARVQAENFGPEGSAWRKSLRNFGTAALAAAAWAALEWLRGIIFTGFGWNSLGVTLHNNLAIIQVSDLTGMAGLSFLLVLVNAMLAITAKRLQVEIARKKVRPHYDLTLAIALVALAFGYGARQLFAPAPESETVTVAAVQANVPILEKRDPAHEDRILKLHLDMSEKALALKPDLLVWPEAATPRPLFQDQATWDAVRKLAEGTTADFLTGTVYFGPEGDFNSAVMLTEHAKKAQLYHKIHLVPFGEYVPMRHSFPLFAMIVGNLVPDDFDFGRDYTVMKLSSKPVRVGPLICFEDTLGDLARHFVLRGAQMFVTVTNDGWFLDSVGSLQHLRQALFRCAENKIPMVRAANTGVTCSIDRFGRVEQMLATDKGKTNFEGFFSVPVQAPKNPKPTFYARYGDVFAMLCLMATVAVVGFGFLQPGRRRRKL